MELILPIALGGSLITAGIYTALTYNRFQTLKNGAEATLGQVQVALKKRLDMIDQLVDSVKSYAEFEREILERITLIRSSLTGTRGAEELGKLEHDTRSLLGKILLTVEAYPELRTSEIVKDLTSSIRSVETELARHRYTYNNIVQEFNTKIDTVPSNLVARIFGFDRLEYLEFGEEIQKRPGVSWGS